MLKLGPHSPQSSAAGGLLPGVIGVIPSSGRRVTGWFGLCDARQLVRPSRARWNLPGPCMTASGVAAWQKRRPSPELARSPRSFAWWV